MRIKARIIKDSWLEIDTSAKTAINDLVLMGDISYLSTKKDSYTYKLVITTKEGITIEVPYNKFRELKHVYEFIRRKLTGEEYVRKVNPNAPYEVDWQLSPIYWVAIYAMNNGLGIAHALRYDSWSEDYTLVERKDGKARYAIYTEEDLMRITRKEFISHRNVGPKSWNSLNEFINELRRKHF